MAYNQRTGQGSDYVLRTGSDELDEARIPDLSASKITSGTLAASHIPDLSASKITSDELDADRIPNLSATKITSGTLAVSHIPDLSANKITTGSLHVDRIPNLDASKITSGTLDAARIPVTDLMGITQSTINQYYYPQHLLRTASMYTTNVSGTHTSRLQFTSADVFSTNDLHHSMLHNESTNFPFTISIMIPQGWAPKKIFVSQTTTASLSTFQKNYYESGQNLEVLDIRNYMTSAAVSVRWRRRPALGLVLMMAHRRRHHPLLLRIRLLRLLRLKKLTPWPWMV